MCWSAPIAIRWPAASPSWCSPPSSCGSARRDSPVSKDRVAALPAVLRREAIRRIDTRALLAGSLTALALGPFLLPDFMVNNLIRAFLYAAAALTVDVLWGYTGILTFGQSAFFGIGVYAAGLIFT